MAVFNNPPPAESEDCLYLNVYAPSAPGQGRAVMYWIYGGSLQFGTAGQIYYDGASFASYQDIIIVSVNYRTNGKQKASYSQSSSDAASLRIPELPRAPQHRTKPRFLRPTRWSRMGPEEHRAVRRRSKQSHHLRRVCRRRLR
jgi:hypothetical protein